MAPKERLGAGSGGLRPREQGLKEFSGPRIAARGGVWGAIPLSDQLSLFCSAPRHGWRGVDFAGPPRSPTSSLSFAPRLAMAGEAWAFLALTKIRPGWFLDEPTAESALVQVST